MRAVQLRIKRLSLRRPESVILVAVTIPIATKYSEPCHCWSVLDGPLSCSLSVRHSMQIASCLLIHTIRRAFHLLYFIDQDTVPRSSDFQRVHTTHVHVVQARLNAFAAVPLRADLRKREQQGCSQLQSTLSCSSFSIHLWFQSIVLSDSSNLSTPVTRVDATTTSKTDFDGLVVVTDSCSRGST